ncbi:putative MFS-type transporter YcnB [Pullulanibacillus camelliae]|uniref:Putative MFS-type transporter YcnB n=1 Tax=Pullulanibacillus camelliae TaxID=1707096 RepID=A0A8J3E130_9BACL|nr:MDR family MFS transporter [Pullulanibacillus camelliae]GGE52887.1 putative MFS-type transporter YcnB [Pullulanibacillus camelliae]
MTDTASHTEQNFKRAPIVMIMLIGAFVGLLNETLLTTALPHIMAAFNITENTVQWLTTAYLLTNGIMIPISAFLIVKFSTRRLFITSMVLFTLGTLIAALSQSFEVLLLGRIVQAAGSGVMMPLMMNVFLTIFPEEKRGAAMGLSGIVIAFAPAIGPSLSGWLVENYAWRSLFYVVLPIAIIVVILAIVYMKNVIPLTRPKIDILSILLSSVGFGGLLYGFSNAGNKGWGSPYVYISLIVGGIVLMFFIWRQLAMKQPLLEFKVFKIGVFSLTICLGMVVMMSLIGAETILPIYMQNMRNFTAFDSGLMLLPGAIVMGIMSPVTGMVFDKIGARWLAVIGLAIVALGTLPFAFLDQSTSFAFLSVMYAIRMFGLSMAMMPIFTAGLNQLPQSMHPHGTAMLNTLQQVAGSIGTAVLFTIMSNVSKHQLSDAKASGAIPNPIEASIHGVNISFIVVTCLAVVALVMAFFLKNPKKQGKDSKEQKVVPVTEN